jgi:hypothetical protein
MPARSRATAGQAARLGGHRGKGAASLGGAGRLEAGVESQQVGLEGDLVDPAGIWLSAPARQARSTSIQPDCVADA